MAAPRPDEAWFRRGLFVLAAALHLCAPLFFFTNLTENPYSVQILLVNTLVFLSLAWGGVCLARTGSLRLFRTPMDAPLFLFLLWALVTWGAAAVSQKSFFFPALFHEGARNALFLWVNVAGIFFLSTQLNGLSGEKLTRLALAVAGISALYAVFQYAGWEPLWEQPVRPFGNRPVSTYGNPNFLSSALALFLPLALGESLRARNAFGSAAWGGLAIIYAGGLLATLTRSSWIGAGFGLVLFLWMERRVLQAQRRRAAWMAVAAMGILLVWSFVHEGRLSPLGRLLELWNGITGSEPYGSWHQRLLIWRSAWEMWAERPWIGRGWGLFELLFPFYQSRLLPFEIFRPFRTHANNAHQLFLEIGCQTGLIGLGIFLFAVVLATVIHGRRVSRLPDKSRSMLNACFAGLAAMSIDNVFGNVSLFFAVPAFLFFWTAGQWAAGAAAQEIFLVPPRWARFAAPWFLGIIALAGIAREARSFVAQIYYLRGTRLSRVGPARSAEKALLESARWRGAAVHTQYALGNNFLGFAREASGRGLPGETARNAEQAVNAYTAALRANAGYAEVFENRAQVLRILDKTEESLRDMEMSLAINPLQEAGYQNWLALSPPGPRSKQVLEQAVFFFPMRKTFWFLLGDARERSGEKAEAREAYARALSLDLDFDEAWQGFRRVDPGSPHGVLETGARLLSAVREDARAGRWAQGRAKAVELVRLFPDYSLARLMAADLAAQSGEDEAAMEGYAGFLAREPGHRAATENFARVLRRRGQGEKADRLLASLPVADLPAGP